MKDPNFFTLSVVDTEQMLAFGRRLASYLLPGMALHLTGELGAGKTTLVRGILHGYGFHSAVKSPTYTLVEPYELSRITLYHFDLYRLLHPQDLFDIGIEDYLQNNVICLIEWPEKAGGCLPEPTLCCTIEPTRQGTERHLVLQAKNEQGHNIIEQLKETT